MQLEVRPDLYVEAVTDQMVDIPGTKVTTMEIPGLHDILLRISDLGVTEVELQDMETAHNIAVTEVLDIGGKSERGYVTKMLGPGAPRKTSIKR